jgi:hypothetical protein
MGLAFGWQVMPSLGEEQFECRNWRTPGPGSLTDDDERTSAFPFRPERTDPLIREYICVNILNVR